MSTLTLPETADLVDSRGRKVPKSPYGEIKVPNIKIVGPRLLVLPTKAMEEESEGGIIIPATAQDTTQRAAVLIVGEGTVLPNGERIPPCVEVGDEIIYARYSGTELKLGRETYLIIQESDVRAVMTYRGKVFTLAQ